MAILQHREHLYSYLIFLMFLTSTDTVLFGTNGNQTFLYVSRLTGLLGFIFLPKLSTSLINDKRCSSLQVWLTCILSTIILLSSLINNDEFPTTISKIIAVLAGSAVACSCSFSQFCKYFENFIYYISIVSILFTICLYVVPSVLHLLPVIENSAGIRYYTAFIGSIAAEGSYNSSFIRSSGIFWEPGAYASYLIWGLMIQFFVLNNCDFKKVCVNLMALFLTFSTTGYVTFGVLAFTYLFFGEKNDYVHRRLRRLIIICFISFLFLLLFATQTVFYDSIFGKIQSDDGEMSGSAQTRFSSIYNGINAFFLNPFIGIGSHTENAMLMIMNRYDVKYASGGTMLTNTIISYFVSFGIFFGFIVLTGMFKFIRLFHSNNIFAYSLLLLVLMLSYSSERFLSFMPFVFVFMGFKYK